jgi:hypothetical protein
MIHLLTLLVSCLRKTKGNCCAEKVVAVFKDTIFLKKEQFPDIWQRC